MTNKSDDETINRAMQSLTKLGFVDCAVRGIRDEFITLDCATADRNDQSMIQVALRLIPGISSVVFENSL